jgi:hypothetical protein
MITSQLVDVSRVKQGVFIFLETDMTTMLLVFKNKAGNEDVIPNEERNPAQFTNVKGFLGGPRNDNIVTQFNS